MVPRRVRGCPAQSQPLPSSRAWAVGTEKGMLRPALRTHEQAHAATAAEAPIDVAAVQWRVRMMNTKNANAETGVAVLSLDHLSTRLPYSPTQTTCMF